MMRHILRWICILNWKQTYTLNTLVENELKRNNFYSEVEANIADLKKNGYYEIAAIQMDARDEVKAFVAKMLN